MMIQSRVKSAIRVIRDVPDIVKENIKVKINDFIALDDLFYNDNVQANAFIKMCELTEKIFTNLNDIEIKDLKSHLIARAYYYTTDKEFKIEEGKLIHYIQKDPTRKEGDISGNKFAIAKTEDVRLKFKLLEKYREWLNNTIFASNETLKTEMKILENKNEFYEKVEDFNFFQIVLISDFEFEGKIYEDIPQRNNDSILTPLNWEDKKEMFFSQRMEKYNEGYTLAEKINLELSTLRELTINKTDYQILKDRYRLYLEKKQSLESELIIKKNPKLKHDQIALKYFYEGLQITRKNSNEIAKEYGHSSGEKLFQRFTFYSSLANRKGRTNPDTRKKLQNKIELFESVIKLLPSEKQYQAKDEVNILKSIFETEYK